jgi:hypothetical protein
MAQSRSTRALSGRSKRTQGMPPASHNTARLEMGSNVQKLGSLVRDKLIAVCTQSLLAGVAEERQLLPQRCAAIAEESAAAPAVVPPPQEPVESRLRSTPLAIRGVRAACHMAPPPAPYGVAQGIPHTKRQRGMRGAAIRWGGPRLATALAAAAHAGSTDWASYPARHGAGAGAGARVRARRSLGRVREPSRRSTRAAERPSLRACHGSPPRP